MDIPLDEVIHFDAITSASDGAASDADSTPAWAIYEEATDTAIQTGSFTKRTSLTGNYRGTATLSAANGFEAGKWYSVIASATVDSVTGKAVIKSFRVVAAETVAGVPVVDAAAAAAQLGTAVDLGGGSDVASNLVDVWNKLGLIEADTDEMQGNQNNWNTATGFAVAGDAMNLTAAYDAAKNAASQASVDALPDADAIVDAIKAYSVEANLTFHEAMQYIAAAHLGKVTDPRTANETFYRAFTDEALFLTNGTEDGARNPTKIT